MALSLGQSQPTISFPESDRVRVADLNPPEDISGSAYVDAQVALIWPYSSSTGQISLLLVETDVPLHSSKRQVKVTFHQGAARSTQESKVGIGDRVKLHLVSCAWSKTGDVISTPGKKLEWDLEFQNSVTLRIDRQNEPPRIVRYVSDDSPPPSNSLKVQIPGVQPPPPTVPSNLKFSYVTPSKSRLTTSTPTFLDNEPDFGHDTDTETGRARKRTRFARRSGGWQLAESNQVHQLKHENNLPGHVQVQDLHDETADISAVEQPVDQNGETFIDIEDMTGVVSKADQQQEPIAVEDMPVQAINDKSLPTELPVVTRDSPEIMKPPQFPVKRRQSASLHIDLDERNESIQTPKAKTPRLIPLASPGLPLVSPLVKKPGLETGYFPIPQTLASELDALADSNRAVREMTSTFDGDVTNMSAVSEDSLVILGERTTSQMQTLGEDRQDLLQIGVNIDDQTLEHDRDVGVADFNSAMMETFPEPTSAAASTSFSQPIDDVQITTREQNVDEVAPPSPEQAKEIVVEDEDMYGPPIMSKTNVDPHESVTQEPRNALDVVSEFLDMSPVLAGFPVASAQSNPFSITENQETVTQNEISIGDSNSEWQTKLEITAVECETEGQYPSPPFPFKQGWHRRNSQGSSRRSSTHTTQSYSLNGVIEKHDVQQTDSSPVESIPNGFYYKELRTAGSEISVSDADEQELEVLEDNLVVKTDETAEVMQISDHDSNSELLSDDVEPSTTGDSSESEVDELRVLTKQNSFFTPPYTQENENESLPNQETESSGLEIHGLPLLPTPAQTQEENGQALQRVVPATIQADVTSSPVYSPKIPVLVNAEVRQMRRTSPRLARKSNDQNNMSSPILSQQQSGYALLSQSPTRNENIPPLSPIRSETGSYIDRKSSPISVVDIRTAVADTASPDKFIPMETIEERSQSTTEPQPLNYRPGITTTISYYAGLARLGEFFGKLVDVVAVCTDSTKVQRAKKGPKDFYVIIRLTDASLSLEETSTITVEVYRPIQSALPLAKPGDVVILHNFKVQSVKHKYTLISTESSAWAVFDAVQNSANSDLGQPVISGPPLEYADGEVTEAKLLAAWWQTDGQRQQPRPGLDDTQIRDIAQLPGQDSPKTASKSREGLRSSTRTRRQENMTDNVNNADDTVSIANDWESQLASSPLSSSFPRNKRATTPRVNGSKRAETSTTPHRRTRSQRSESVVHELRDGRKYVDDNIIPDRRGKRGESVIHELRDGVTYIDE